LIARAGKSRLVVKKDLGMIILMRLWWGMGIKKKRIMNLRGVYHFWMMKRKKGWAMMEVRMGRRRVNRSE